MEVSKAITYFYPHFSKAGTLKVFQDLTSQIRGFYFTKSNINDVEKLEYVNNYAVYFLFENNNDEPLIYVGQSENGISRIKNHVINKNFWNYCIMFVTDNNQFDKTCIDYLEWYFINLFKKTAFSLENSQERFKEPNIDTSFTKPTILNYASQIEFLLEANGLNLNIDLITEGSPSNKKTYSAPSNTKASLYLHDGNYILKAGSIIKCPAAETKSWKDEGKFYSRFKNKFDELIETNQATLIDENSAQLLNDLVCNSPSFAGSLCTGRATNGWRFWQGLSDERDNI